MTGWENFLIAQGGASAALTGLIFVGVSINLSRIVSLGGLPERALEALVVLLAILVASSLLLVPQPLTLAGVELLLVGLADIAILLTLLVNAWRKTAPQYQKYLRHRTLLSPCAALFFAIAGIAVLIWNAGGLYWIVPATILSVLVAIFDAWVLLVEINR